LILEQLNSIILGNNYHFFSILSGHVARIREKYIQSFCRKT
jgi:5-methylcytosine-specific restriction endonuclease McrBC regulatory subunit McrC